jgi:hypothetical protein
MADGFVEEEDSRSSSAAGAMTRDPCLRFLSATAGNTMMSRGPTRVSAIS